MFFRQPTIDWSQNTYYEFCKECIYKKLQESTQLMYAYEILGFVEVQVLLFLKIKPIMTCENNVLCVGCVT